MTDVPNNLQYSKSHEWVRIEGDDVLAVGITDHAQKALGDLVFVDLPQPATQVQAGQEVAVIESVKTAADVYSPVSGEIVAINHELIDNPGKLNEDSYGMGWLFRIRVHDKSQLDGLLDAQAYQQVISEA